MTEAVASTGATPIVTWHTPDTTAGLLPPPPPAMGADTAAVSPAARAGRAAIDNRLRFPDTYVRLRGNLDAAKDDSRIATIHFERVVRGLPNLTASFQRRERLHDVRVGTTGRRAIGDTTIDRQKALSEAFSILNVQIGALVGFSDEHRRDVVTLLTMDFGRQQAEAISRLFAVRAASLDQIRAQALLDVFEGRLTGETFAGELTRRLTEEARRSDDQLRAVTAPMGIFLSGSQAFYDTINRSGQSAIRQMVDRSMQLLAQTGYVPPTQSPILNGPQASPWQTTVRAGVMYSFARDDRAYDFVVDRPGSVTLALLAWQAAGIVAVGEMPLVVDRLCNGMPAAQPLPSGPPNTAAILERWARQKQVIILTPSLIERLATAINAPGGLDVGGERLTPATLDAWLQRQPLPNALLRAIGIDTSSVFSLELAMMRERRQIGAIAIGGELLLANSGLTSQTLVPGAGASIAWRSTQTTEAVRHLEISHGVRRIRRDPAQTGTGFGLIGGASTEDGGRGQITGFLSF